MNTLEALLREDLNVPKQKEVNVNSTLHHSNHLSRHVRKRIHHREDSISSDSGRSSSGLSSASSGDANGHRSVGEPGWRATYNCRRAVGSQERGDRHFGIIELKSENPLYRYLLSYRYY